MRALQLLLACAYFVSCCYSNGLSVFGPKNIRPNSNFAVVFSNSLDRNVRLNATLKNQDDPSELQETKILLVNRRTTRQIEFNVGTITQGDYQLIIQSLEKTFSFDHQVDLEYEAKTMSAFIQTDKPVYTPGDKLRLRVIVVDVNTRPVTSIKTVQISIKDAQDNSIREWPFARLYNGVFESSVQLPASPPLGNWTMKVTAPGIESYKYFEVKEYVAPKFFVKAYPSEILLQKDQVVSITVETAYTIGEPVEGDFEAKLFLDDTVKKPNFIKSGHINGRTSFDFNLEEEVDIEGEEPFSEVTLTVDVKEAFSNRTVNISEKIPIYRNPYMVATLSTPSFRPGLPYAVTLAVKDHLGRPPAGHKPNKVLIEAEFDLPSGSDTKSMAVKLDEKGIASFELKPSSAAVALRIMAEYDEVRYEETHEGMIFAAQSESNQYIKVHINPKFKVQINKNVEFIISCTELMTHFAYIVVARGQILKSSYVPVQRKRTHKLRLTMTPDMSPKARLLVYYTNRNFVIFDDVELKFDKFNNDFKVTLDKEEYTPGEDINLDVYAAKDSYVAFSAIDQSVLLVGEERHDFDRNDVLQELAKFGSSDSESEFDLINKFGLFLRSTAQLDTPTSRGNSGQRYGSSLLSSNKRRMKAIHIRTQFDESFLWRNFSMNGRDAYKEIVDTVPDSITTYFISGFALSPTMGLGVINKPLKFIVKQKFYLVANLPYSIKRGEVALVQVTVFNYLGNDVTTTVRLYNKLEEIEFVEQSSDDPKTRTKSVIAPTGNGKSVSFLIKAKKLGLIAIKLQAESQLASDAIEHMLRVTPESHMYEKNLPNFIELPTFGKQEFSHNLEIPKKHDEGSVKIKVTLDPDILGTAIANLEELIRLPTGCACQNMIKFVPNIVVLDYLTETGTVADDVKSRAIDYLTKGLQNQLQYRGPDGSFGLWRNTNKGNTFLTAFIAKSLKIAAKHITVDKSIVDNAFNWLVSKQSPDGQFPEVGTIFGRHFQGGTATSRFALTAYVLIALAEDQESLQKYRANVDRTANYLWNNFHHINDQYDLSLVTYGFFLIDHRHKQNVFDKLVETSRYDREQNVRYWNNTPVHIETTAYALLSYMANGMTLDATPIMRWLSKQRYDLGAYPGTQDTYVGLKALAAFAAKTSAHKNNYQLRITHEPRRTHSFDVDHTNKLAIQEVDIPHTVRKLKVEANGIGHGVIQVAYQYWQNIMDKTKYAFDLDVEMLNTTTDHVQHLKICVAFIQKEAYKDSNMALVEIFLPSGLVVGPDAVNDLTGRIQNIERRFSDTSVVVYYNSLSTEPDCFIVTAERKFQVALHLPSYVKVYDYYSRDDFAIKQYEGKVMQLCDICEDEDCETLSC